MKTISLSSLATNKTGSAQQPAFTDEEKRLLFVMGRRSGKTRLHLAFELTFMVEKEMLTAEEAEVVWQS